MIFELCQWSNVFKGTATKKNVRYIIGISKFSDTEGGRQKRPEPERAIEMKREKILSIV